MSRGKSFEALKAEIAQLEIQAAAARRVEIKEAVASIREIINKYSLTAADLGFKGQGLSMSRAKAGTSRPGAGVPRYLNPKNGKTWTGFGKPPAWIASAKNRDIYLIDKGTAPPSVAAAPSAPAKERGAAAKKQASKPVAKPATKPAAKPASKASAKPAAKPLKKASTPAKTPSSPAPKAAAAVRPKVAVRKVEGPKRPRPAARKAAVGAGTGETAPAAASAPAASASPTS